MFEQLERLRAERGRVWSAVKAMADQAAAENRAFTETEARLYEEQTARLDQFDARIGELAEQDRRVADADDAFRRLAGASGPVRDAEVEDRFRAAVLRRDPAPIDVSWPNPQSGVQLRDLGTGTGGGMLGTTVYGRILDHLVENSAVMAAGATLISRGTGEPLEIPRGTADSASQIVTEGATIPESDPTLGTKTLTPFKHAFMITVSIELVEDSAFNLTDYLAQQAGRALANGAGALFVTGSGTNEPEGLLTSVVGGVTGAAGVVAPTADDLIDLQQSVVSGYQMRGSWLMNSATLAGVRKLKDPATGSFLFDLSAGARARGSVGNLLGNPVYVDPNIPDAATGAASVLFGDFSRFFVAQVNGIRFERSDHFKWDTAQASFRAMWRADGALIDVDAVRSFVGG